jgi:hypothetical protein
MYSNHIEFDYKRVILKEYIFFVKHMRVAEQKWQLFQYAKVS